MFGVSALLTLVFVAVTIAFTETVGETFATASVALLDATGWFYILGVTTFLVFLSWVAFSRYGHLRLGQDDDRPEYSNPVWFGMLFAAGIGTILMFWGVAEPMSHFAEPPMGDVEPRSVEAATEAMSFALYHFGLHTWSIFGLPALGFAFFAHRRGLPMRVSSVLHPLLGDRIQGPAGWAIDILAVIGTLFGVAVSLGLGTLQINSGLAYLTPLEEAPIVQFGLIGIITVIAVISVALGLDRGIRRLSNVNIGLAVGLLLFVIVVGPTLLLLRGIVQSTGNYLTSLPFLAFWTDALEDTGWQRNWTVFYWAWTITWAPFVGIFIARISKGRTIKEFVLGVLLTPTAFTIIWFSTFGLAAIDLDLQQDGAIAEAVLEDVPVSLFVFLENFPLAGFVSGLAVLIVVIFFTTSSDSASLVVDMQCSSDVTDDPPTRQRVFWALVEGTIAATLLAIGGLEALQDVITVLGFPFFALGLVIIWSLLRGLREESLEPVGPRRRPRTDA
ncbi:multidrug DMT transporter permease [Egicoccus halophilus]|uniref:Multidrug DMT transporter permease n=1 Tax=Egicoccus halophilus TaxID=1670830 RepID=A0A8J3ABX1_9ACTN|nr:multidrug DMT transporter permease [Egicoccus halophilus]